LIKVTESNIKRISESVLCDRLDYLYDLNRTSCNEHKLIEVELDKRATYFCEIQSKKKAEKAKLKAKQEELHQAFMKIKSQNSKINIMDAMVFEFGDDFTKDYIVEDFSITSNVHSCNHKNNNYWEFETIKQTKRKLKYLIYWRVYDKYFRNNLTQESLNRLKERVIQLKGAV
jgi:hypothetical protein